MGVDHYSLDNEWKKDIPALTRELQMLKAYDYNDFFLMVTADYPEDRFLEVSRAIKLLLDQGQIFVVKMG